MDCCLCDVAEEDHRKRRKLHKFVIDNVDKNVKLSFQRDKIQGHSYHCVHGYCVQDRVETSMLSDREPQFRKADPMVMVPSQTDIDNVKDEMVTFVKRYVEAHNYEFCLQDYSPTF